MVLGLLRAGATAAPTLHYTARLHGLPVLDVTYCLDLTDHAYRSRLQARTLGLAEFLVHGRVDGRADGAIQGLALHPQSYIEHGRLSGEDFSLAIDYPAGDPVIREMAPPATKYRTAVPTGDLHGAIDGLAAITLEVLVVSRTQACQGVALVYDARQLRRLTTRTAGSDILAASARSVFTGGAVRCDTQSVLLSGLRKDQPASVQIRPHASSAWLAPLSTGGLALPVRFSFGADFLGDITVELDGVTNAVGCVSDASLR